MSLRVMPNVERLVFDFLRSVQDVSDLVDQRVFTSFDAARGLPQVVVSRFAGPQDQYGILDHPRLQIEAWAAPGARPEAHGLIQAVRAAMLTISERGGRHPEGTVTKCEELNLLFLPDPVSTGGPARPRYILDIRVHCKPLRNGS